MRYKSIEIKQEPEKAILVGAELRNTETLLTLAESLDELDRLSNTAGLEVVGRITQKLHLIDPSTYIGSGKVAEVISLIQSSQATVVIFDDELSPRHQRELEKMLGDKIKLLDRSALILDIFAQHAHTHEGALQVELAQYQYRLPRLTRQWTHLARQAGGGGARGGAGGVGLRGPGETQLEIDQREIGLKISKLKYDIEQVRKQRQTYRNKRKKAGVPLISLVGYTNAGKSTLLKALTGADTYIADQLFATLDPITRMSQLPSGRSILFSDTVGFIQKLPTSLVLAFRATLEEINEATILLHVVDMSHPNALEHIEAVEDTLAEIEIPNGVRRLLVWNKADLASSPIPPRLHKQQVEYDDEVVISAQSGLGIAELLDKVEATLLKSAYTVRLLIPYSAGHLTSELFVRATVVHSEHTAEGTLMTVHLPLNLYQKYAMYQYFEKETDDVEND
ncbi:MAG: GTPase HflX [Phototrophicaceae bacterium]